VKFIVAQVGARRSYAVPAILEKAGMLDRFYTDITGDIGLGAVFSAAAVLPLSANPRAGWPHGVCRSTFVQRQRRFPGISLVHALREAMVARDPAALVVRGFVFPMRSAWR
jgi:hypothetical protein